MESKHMTQQVFAQFIDMSPASLSSIFNGRTKPTLNIVEAIKKKIPDINIDWLLFGIGDMYGIEQSGAGGADGGPVHNGAEPMLDFEGNDNSSSTVHGAVEPQSFSSHPHPNGVRGVRPEIVREEVKYVERPQRRVVEIRVYYDDLTYETFVPAKK